MSLTPTPGIAPSRLAALRELTVPAQVAATFFMSFGRALHTSRLYRLDNPIVVALRDELYATLTGALTAYGAWRLRITPFEIFLVDEAVVRAKVVKPGEDYLPSPEEKLPFLLYRDGVRTLTIQPDLSRADFDALYGAMLAVSIGINTQDDMVTLLWQANTQKLRIEVVPLTQTIYLHARRPPERRSGGSHQGHSYAWSPVGSEIRADIGQLEGATAGLHKDTFDDWPLPRDTVDVAEAFAKLDRSMQFVRTRLLAEWAAENSVDWQMDAEIMLEKIHALDPDPRTRVALANAVITWLVAALQRCAWDESRQALTLLRTFDPGGTLTDETLAQSMAELDTDTIAEQLDESTNEEQARFYALAVTIGRPAIEMACAVMAKAAKSRTRAAACTMLAYLCAAEPALLTPWLADSRWYVVRNTVFVLGQIGGADVLPMLQVAAYHTESRVRRAVVQALGNCPGPDRVPLLLAQLGTRDGQLLAATLNMLGRFRSPIAARAILRQIEAPDFEERPADVQRALITALGEMGDDEIVPRLEELLHRGGWFARPTAQRTGVARTLQRIGSPAALAALEAGLRSHSEVVRIACLDAIEMRSA